MTIQNYYNFIRNIAMLLRSLQCFNGYPLNTELI